MLMNPGAEYAFDGAVHRYPEVRLVYWAGGNPFHHHQDLNRLRRGVAAARDGRRPRAVVDRRPHAWPTSSCRPPRPSSATTSAPASREPWLDRDAAQRRPAGRGPQRPADLRGARRAARCRRRYTDGLDDAGALRAMYEQARESAAEHGHPIPDFDTFWDRATTATSCRRLHRRSPRSARTPTPRRWPRRPGGSSCSPRRSTASATTTAPATPTWLPPTEWTGSAARALPDPPALAPARHPPAQPARHGRGEPGVEGRRAGSRAWCNTGDAAARGVAAATSCGCSTTAARPTPARSSPTTSPREWRCWPPAPGTRPLDPAVADIGRAARQPERPVPRRRRPRACPRAARAQSVLVQIERAEGPAPSAIRTRRPRGRRDARRRGPRSLPRAVGRGVRRRLRHERAHTAAARLPRHARPRPPTR